MEFDSEQQPAEVTVTMTTREAALLTKHCGRQSAVTAGENYGGTSALYDTLTSYVFNAYWDDGVDGYLAGEQS